MSREDKGKGMHLENDYKFGPTQKTIQLINYPRDPLLFYLHDHELCYTSFYGPRYKESAIFINYQEWYVSAAIPFYQYLKIIKVYQALVQDVSNHPVLIVMPIGYIESFKWFHKQFEYWTAFEPHIF